MADIFDKVGGPSRGGDVFDLVSGEPLQPHGPGPSLPAPLAGLLEPRPGTRPPVAGSTPTGMIPLNWMKAGRPIGSETPTPGRTTAWPVMTAKAKEMLADAAGTAWLDVQENILQPAWGTLKDMGNALGAWTLDVPYEMFTGRKGPFTRRLETDPGPTVGLLRLLTDWNTAAAAGKQIWHELTHPLETLARRPVTAPLDLLGLVLGGASLARRAGRLGTRAVGSRVARRLDTHAWLKEKLGTQSEALGADVYGLLDRNKAETGLMAKRMAAETGARSLSPGMQKIMRAAGFLSPNRGLIAGQTIRDAAWLMGPPGRALARKMGITPDEMVAAARIAETIPTQAVTPEGILRFGVKTADAEGNPAWRHGLDPRQAQELFAAQRPEVQRFILEYVEPAKGYQGPVRLKELPPPDGSLMKGRVPLRRVFFGDDAPVSNLREFMRLSMKEGRNYFGDDRYVWVAKSDAWTSRQMGLDAPLDFVFGRRGMKHVEEALRVDRKGRLSQETPGSLAEAITAATHPNWMLYDPRGEKWVLARRNGKDKILVLEIEAHGNYLEIISAKNADPRYLDDIAKRIKKRSQPGGTATPHYTGAAQRVLSPPHAVFPASQAGNISIATAEAGGNTVGAVLPMPMRPKAQPPTTFSRNKAFEEAVAAGILEPGQHVEGYVHYLRPDPPEPARLNRQVPEMELKPLDAGFAERRLAKLPPANLRLDEAVTAYRQALGAARLNRRMLRELGPMILTEAPKRVGPRGEMIDVNPAPEDLVRTREAYNPVTRQMETRRERLTLVELANPEEAAALGVAPGRYLIPQSFAETFDLLLGRIKAGKLDTWLEGAPQVGKDLARYWVRNVLSAPGTVVTNLLGGLTQYSGKFFEDLWRGDLRLVGQDLAAPAAALRPKRIRQTPAVILGDNVATQFGEDLGLFFHNVNSRIKAGESLPLTTRALARLDQALAGLYRITMAPFGAVDNYWKRAIYLSEMKTWAQREARSLAEAGLIRPGQVRATTERLTAGAFEHHPELYSRVMQGPVDRFGYDYANIPRWLDKWRRHPVGTALAPFMVYPYKYARMLGSQARAFNPLLDMPLKERLARAGGLATAVGLPYAIRELLAGDSQIAADRERFTREHPGAPQPGINLGGREFIGSFSPGRETWLRTAKYGYANLPAAVMRRWEGLFDFLDEFKSEGPLLPTLGMALGMEPRRGRRDFPSIAGKLAASLIPLNRVLEYYAKANDIDPATGRIPLRRPVGFMEQIQKIIPGLRQNLHQPIDPYTGQPVTLDPTEELLKFWTGINLRTLDVAREKRAIAEAVLRWSDRFMNDAALVEFYARRHPDVPVEKLQAALPKIRRAGHDYLRSQFKTIGHEVFRRWLVAGGDIHNPAEVEQMAELARRVGNARVRSLVRLRNLMTAGQLLRLAAGDAWVRQHLENKPAGDVFDRLQERRP